MKKPGGHFKELIAGYNIWIYWYFARSGCLL